MPSPPLHALFPDGVAVAAATPAMWEEPLRPEEEACVRGAGPRRLRELRAGRACARAALRALGLPPAAIPVGSDRSPVWPEGVVGSITHTGDFCAAALARRAQILGLGFDAERRGRVGARVVLRVCTPRERAWLEPALAGEAPAADPDLPAADLATLVFAAKECGVKALRSAGARTPRLAQVEVLERPARGRFRLALRDPSACARLDHAVLDSRFALAADLALAALTLRASPQRST